MGRVYPLLLTIKAQLQNYAAVNGFSVLPLCVSHINIRYTSELLKEYSRANSHKTLINHSYSQILLGGAAHCLLYVLVVWHHYV